MDSKGLHYWEVLRNAYQSIDNTYHQKLNILESFLEKAPNSEMFINFLDWEKLSTLPNSIKEPKLSICHKNQQLLFLEGMNCYGEIQNNVLIQKVLILF